MKKIPPISFFEYRGSFLKCFHIFDCGTTIVIVEITFEGSADSGTEFILRVYIRSENNAVVFYPGCEVYKRKVSTRRGFEIGLDFFFTDDPEIAFV